MKTTPVALVTGGTRGIGHAVCVRLATEGYRIAAFGRSAAEDVQDNLQAIQTAAIQPTTIPKDIIPKDTPDEARFLYVRGSIDVEEDRKKLVETVLQQFGRIDVLVNNAGVAPSVRMDLLQTTAESFDRVMAINLRGPFFLTQHVANVMVETLQNGFHNMGREVTEIYHPKIINIASISSYVSSTMRGEYCISKAGLSMMTSLFADRLAEYGIGVYEIRPGIIATDMTAAVTEKYTKLINDGLLPFRRWGTSEDVASAVAMLCHGALPYSTGEVINVDGGFHLRRL